MVQHRVLNKFVKMCDIENDSERVEYGGVGWSTSTVFVQQLINIDGVSLFVQFMCGRRVTVVCGTGVV